MELLAHLHVEGAWHDICDEDIGDPIRPIWDPPQYPSVPIVEYAKSHHLQPEVPWEGVSLVREYN